MTGVVRGGFFWTMVVLASLVALVSYRYLLPGAPGGAPSILANRFTHLGALTAHAGFAATALLIGPLQFFAGIRRRWPVVHRRLGALYLTACLCAGLAGLVLAFGVTTGPIATAGFAILAGLWIVCAAQAWRLALARDFLRHERWVVRSFALTLAAVTLRLYLPISAVLHLDMDAAYRAIAFLCWVPNLIIAEALLAAGFRTSRLPAAPSRSPG